MYVDSLAYVKAKGVENEQFKIDNGVRQWCIMSPLAFYVYMGAVMKEVGMGRGLVRFREDGREWRLPGLLYAGDLVLYDELEEDRGED